MATGAEVLEMLLPQGGWIIVGDDFENITWVDDRPKCTKSEYNAGFTKFDAWKVDQDVKEATALKTATAKLTALGLTAADLRALGL